MRFPGVRFRLNRVRYARDSSANANTMYNVLCSSINDLNIVKIKCFVWQCNTYCEMRAWGKVGVDDVICRVSNYINCMQNYNIYYMYTYN